VSEGAPVKRPPTPFGLLKAVKGVFWGQEQRLKWSVEQVMDALDMQKRQIGGDQQEMPWLLGKDLKTIITDGNPELLKALQGIYPFIKRHRCIAHKMRKVAVKVRKANQAHYLQDAQVCFAPENREEAIKRFKT
jgi:hypothetical protein